MTVCLIVLVHITGQVIVTECHMENISGVTKSINLRQGLWVYIEVILKAVLIDTIKLKFKFKLIRHIWGDNASEIRFCECTFIDLHWNRKLSSTKIAKKFWNSEN